MEPAGGQARSVGNTGIIPRLADFTAHAHTHGGPRQGLEAHRPNRSLDAMALGIPGQGRLRGFPRILPRFAADVPQGARHVRPDDPIRPLAR